MTTQSSGEPPTPRDSCSVGQGWGPSFCISNTSQVTPCGQMEQQGSKGRNPASSAPILLSTHRKQREDPSAMCFPGTVLGTSTTLSKGHKEQVSAGKAVLWALPSLAGLLRAFSRHQLLLGWETSRLAGSIDVAGDVHSF